MQTSVMALREGRGGVVNEGRVRKKPARLIPAPLAWISVCQSPHMGKPARAFIDSPLLPIP